MTDIILFGGTSEGRTIAELLGKKQINTLVCVATQYGEGLLTSSGTLRVCKGRMDSAQMSALLVREKPRLIIDATHPFALEVSKNIGLACQQLGIKRITVQRSSFDCGGCKAFSTLEQLMSWLSSQPGTIFSTLGVKEAQALTVIPGYRERVWLRILPDIDGLSSCIDAGFPQKHIICMQGPFSRELNTAMLLAAGTDILVTKETGAAGGYPEKLAAAKECGITAAVLLRPKQDSGISLAMVIKLIEEEYL